MTFTVLIFSYRKQGTTPASFKTHYETIHIPLIQSLTGPHFPQSHKRYYIQRSSDDTTTSEHANAYPATVLAGTQSDFQYDAFAELTFEDEAEFQTLMGIVGQGEARERIARDEEVFMERERMQVVVVEGPVVTGRVVGGA
ncbi:EthD domain-containing protein [Usnea florida]